MDVLVAGTPAPDPPTLLGSERMAGSLRSLADDYELDVFDTAPALLVADAVPLMSLVDGVLIVGCVGLTRREEAATLRDELAGLGAPILGVIANRVRKGSGRRYGYYPDERKRGRRLSPHPVSARPEQGHLSVAGE
jgi:Mrp family chromosome partitioning ATPase